MAKSLEIIYLDHSGFAVKTDKHLLIFDYYKDPSKSLPSLMNDQAPVYVFSSHSHADHFNPEIAKWSHKTKAYFLSEDIKEVGGLKGGAESRIIYMKPYETRENQGINVTTYGSTDKGVSFLVNADNWNIFHAGDLNWWHWKEDTLENIQAAENDFKKEMEILKGLAVDIAFFPVDSRLAEFWAIGVTEFCRAVKVRQLVTMHSCGKLWNPPVGFPAGEVWCPEKAGQKQLIKKDCD